MCVFHLFWLQSHGSRRDVYFTLQGIQGTTLCTVFFCPSEPIGVTQEGVNTGAFFFFFFFFIAPPTPAVLAFFFLARRVQPSLPSSIMTSNFVYSRSFSASCRFPLPGTNVRNPTLVEI